MLVRFGSVGPHYVVPPLVEGEVWVGRPLDAVADALSAQKLLFRVPAAAHSSPAVHICEHGTAGIGSEDK